MFSTTLLSFNGPDAGQRYGGWSTDEAGPSHVFGTLFREIRVAGTLTSPTALAGRLYPGFAESCTITADLTTLAAVTKILKTPTGEKYREL